MATVTVCSKLPFDFVAECAGVSVTFAGARGIDPATGDKYLIDGFGMTPGVDADWFALWAEEAADFMPLKNGVIFAAAATKAADESKERKKSTRSGMEQKSTESLGVEARSDT